MTSREGDWREILIEVEPGVFKPADDCTEAEAVAGLANQEEIMALRARYRVALGALRDLAAAGVALHLPEWFVFEVEMWNINLVSLRECVPEIERILEHHLSGALRHQMPPGPLAWRRREPGR